MTLTHAAKRPSSFHAQCPKPAGVSPPRTSLGRRGLFCLACLVVAITSGGLQSAPVIRTQPNDKRVLEGAAATLNVAASGDGPLSYQWFFQGADLPGATNPAFALLQARLTNAGNYFVSVGNTSGVATSRVARLEVGFGLTVTHRGPGRAEVKPALKVYDPGSRVWLQAVPDTGRAFLRWSGAVVTNANPIEVTMTNHLSVVAEFSHLPGDLLWSFDIGGDSGGDISCPAVGPDGTLYIGGGKMFALDGTTGEKKWEFAAAATRPVVGPDGAVIVVPSGYDSDPTTRKVYALDGSTGEKKWEASLPWAGGWPAVGGVGLIYLLAGNSIYALDASTGAEQWRFNGPAFPGNLVLGEDGTVYFTFGDFAGLCALDGRTGQQRWRLGAGGAHPESSQDDAVVGANDVIYVSDFSPRGPAPLGYPYLHARNSSTGRAWNVPGALSCLGIGGGGILFAVTAKDMGFPMSPNTVSLSFASLNPENGHAIWQLPWWTGPHSGIRVPAVAEDGTVYLSMNRFMTEFFFAGSLEALDGGGGSTKWSFVPPGSVAGWSPRSFSEPALGPDGTVYIGCANGTLYALQGSGSGLADSPWPKARANPRNTGQAYTVFPKLSVPTGGGLYLEGSPVELRADATSPAPLSLQWRFNGQPIPGATNSAWNIASLAKNDAGPYTLMASNAFATVISRPAVVSVRNVEAGKWALLRFTASAGTPLQVQSAESLGGPAAWRPLADLTLPASSDGFVDETASATAQRFYRTTQQDRLGIQVLPGWMLRGPVGSQYRIDYVDEATGLEDWKPITNLTLPGSPYLFVDRSATNGLPRYYRTTPLP